jgi:hypothetical protein
MIKVKELHLKGNNLFRVKYLFALCALRPLFFAHLVSLFTKFSTGGI